MAKWLLPAEGRPLNLYRRGFHALDRKTSASLKGAVETRYFLRGVFFFGTGNSAAEILINSLNQFRLSHLSPTIRKQALAPGYGTPSVMFPMKDLPDSVGLTNS